MELMMPIFFGGALRCSILNLSLLLVAIGAGATAHAAPVKYIGSVVTDVSLGGHKMHNAEVTITFVGDTNNIGTYDFASNSIVPGCAQPANSDFCGLSVGMATVRIASGGHNFNATLKPNQILVALDTNNGGVGFSGYVGPNGFEPTYPLGIDSGTVFTLADLTTATSVSGKAYSCIGFTTGPYNCSDPTVYPLKTDHGDLAIYQPYSQLNADGTLAGHYDDGSMNTAVFSIVMLGH
jgi:hypothetical protein